MASKKNRPALIELIDRGNVSTPGWFYGKKKTRLQQLRKGTLTAPPQAEEPAIPPAAEAPPPQPIPPTASQAQPEPITLPDQTSSSRTWIAFTPDRMIIALHYWKVIPLIVLGLILALLIAYRIGLGSASGPSSSTTSLEDAPPSRKLVEAGKQPVRTDLLEKTTDPGQTANPADQKTNPGSVASRDAPGKTITPAPPQTGNCLILCGHQDRNVLEPVRRFFQAGGIPTLIGRYGSQYVLVPAQAVPSTTSPEAEALERRATTMGARYENEKSRNAPSFTAAWRSPYFVRATDIQF